MVKNPRIVKPTPLVPAGSSKNDDVDSEITANRATALLLRSVVEHRIVLLKKMVVLASPLKERAVLVD